MRSKVEEVVSGLHAEGFVHGDIRDANLLIDRESLGKEVKAVKSPFSLVLTGLGRSKPPRTW